MNMQSYEILRQTEEFINKTDSIRFKATFTCPDEAFKFELTSKLTGETSVFFIIANNINVDFANKLADVIMGGLGYERKEPWK